MYGTPGFKTKQWFAVGASLASLTRHAISTYRTIVSKETTEEMTPAELTATLDDYKHKARIAIALVFLGLATKTCLDEGMILKAAVQKKDPYGYLPA